MSILEDSVKHLITFNVYVNKILISAYGNYSMVKVRQSHGFDIVTCLGLETDVRSVIGCEWSTAAWKSDVLNASPRSRPPTLLFTTQHNELTSCLFYMAVIAIRKSCYERTTRLVGMWLWCDSGWIQIADVSYTCRLANCLSRVVRFFNLSHLQLRSCRLSAMNNTEPIFSADLLGIWPEFYCVCRLNVNQAFHCANLTIADAFAVFDCPKVYRC